MRQLGFIGTAFLILSLAACSGKKEEKTGDKDGGKDSGKKTTEEKLLGTWEMTKGPAEALGSTLEFAKDGKLTQTAKIKGMEPVVMPATYKVEGDKFIVSMKVGGKDIKDENKIKELSDTKLITEDKDGKVEEYTKK
jgi:uncharacterized protein (TIGR03066 family)